jgi:hypothetical protein
MNTVTTTIHRAELLQCGCRVCPDSGAVFTTCPRHTCSPVVSFKELPEHGQTFVALPKHPEGLKPLCPECASPRIRPDTDKITCLEIECGAEFMPSDVSGFALSVDSKPRQCPLCTAISYGPCSCHNSTLDRR